MKAKLVAFKGRRRDVINNYGIIEVDGGNAASLIGRKISWRSESGKAIAGVILRTHGKRALLARFKKGLPGAALGKPITLRAIKIQAKKAKKPKKKKAPTKKEKPVKKGKKAPAKAVKAKIEKKKAPKKKTSKKAPKKPVKKTPSKTGKKKASRGGRAAKK